MQKLERLAALGRVTLVVAACVGLAACETKTNVDPAPVPSAPAAAVATPPSASAASAEAVPSGKTPAPSESAAAAAPSELQGTWEGRYEAKRGDVEMPPKVKDKVRAKDDGKAAIGKGTLTLTIGPDGELKGKTEGALGTATLTGKAEGPSLSGTFFPDDALAKLAMFGIVQGKLDAGHVKGRVRVASGDASIVREAEFELSKK